MYNMYFLYFKMKLVMPKFEVRMSAIDKLKRRLIEMSNSLNSDKKNKHHG